MCSSEDGGIFLTGLGLYSEPQSGAFIAPPDSNARWDDPGYENPTEHQFGAMTRRGVNGKHGFLFHDDCWSLVKQAYHPAPVPLERLYNVINSLPMGRLGARVDWGHTYGGFGVALGEEKDFFPWERGLASQQYCEDPPNMQYLVSPLALSEVDDILAEPPQAPESGHTRPSQTPGFALPRRDIFASLPEELCSAVAVWLPTDDVLNVRLASRSFWNVCDNQQFWASRFWGADSERSWLFEAIEQPKSTGTGIPRRDWRWLYHRTTDARLGPAAKNRKRVWALIQHVVKILDLSWNELPAGLPFPVHFPEEASPMPSEVVVVAGSIQSYATPRVLVNRPQKPKLQRVVIPVDGILRIAASIVRLGHFEYIAGLSLTMASGHVLRLGYSTPVDPECSVPLEGASIAGFNVAVGLGGIHALQCVSGSGARRKVFAWLGSPGDAPRTERVSEVASGQAMVLDLSFDVRFPPPFLFISAVLSSNSANQPWVQIQGFRMTGVAIEVNQPVHPPTGSGSHDGYDLRRLAIWHPDVPPRGLNLNESFVVAPDAYTWGYTPLFWTYFGGCGGVHLASLEKVTIRRASGCIHFSFANPEIPDECRRFGRSAKYAERDNKTEAVELLIDGPGGEIIDKVELCQKLLPDDDDSGWLARQGMLAWLKVISYPSSIF